jgi:hypothetical protein
MRLLLLLFLIAGCTKQRVSLGPNIGVRSGKIGAEIAGEVASGEGIGFVASGGGRLVEGLSGGGFRFGVEAEKAPMPWGGRITFTMGPTWIGSDDGGGEATLDARASFAVYRGYKDRPDEWASEDRTTIGVELFASSIGVETDRHDVFIGVGVTFGKWDNSSIGWASVAPPPRDY